jgi:hypothetical protein
VVGDYQYVFFVHKYLNTANEEALLKDPIPLRLSEARVDLYIKGRNEPMFTFNVPAQDYENPQQILKPTEKESEYIHSFLH